MADKTAPEVRVSTRDALSTAAASKQLLAGTRAFGNAAAKLDLQRATAAFQAKAAAIRQAESADNTNHSSK